MALGVRLGTELLPGGMESGGRRPRSRRFRITQGLIDYVNLTLGTDYNPHKMIGAMHEPMGYELPYDVPIRHARSTADTRRGPLPHARRADQVIGAGDADLVALTRAHIADPDLVPKTLAGRVEQSGPASAAITAA